MSSNEWTVMVFFFVGVYVTLVVIGNGLDRIIGILREIRDKR